MTAECFLCGHSRPCRCDRIARDAAIVEGFFTGTLRHPDTLEAFEKKIQEQKVDRR